MKFFMYTLAALAFVAAVAKADTTTFTKVNNQVQLTTTKQVVEVKSIKDIDAQITNLTMQQNMINSQITSLQGISVDLTTQINAQKTLRAQIVSQYPTLPTN